MKFPSVMLSCGCGCNTYKIEMYPIFDDLDAVKETRYNFICSNCGLSTEDEIDRAIDQVVYDEYGLL